MGRHKKASKAAPTAAPNAVPKARPASPRETAAGPASSAVLAGVAFGVALLGYVLVPTLAGLPAPLAPEGLLARGLVCGLLAGLAVTPALQPMRAAALGALAAVAGRLLLIPTYGADVVPASVAAAALAAAVALLVGTAVARGWGRQAALGGLVVVVCVFLWRVGFLPGQARSLLVPKMTRSLAQAPAPETYEFDGALYLRAYYLQKEGMPHYQAFERAYVEDRRASGPPPSRLSYRPPALFAFWAALPGTAGAAAIYWAYVLFGVLVLLASYVVATSLVAPPPALLAPLALGTYLAQATLSTYFTFSELWGGGLAVVALAAALRRRWIAAAAALVLAAAVRELMVLLVPAFVVAVWLYRAEYRDDRAGRARVTAAGLAGAFGAVLVVALHLASAPAAQGAGVGVGVWLHGGLGRLSNALAFSGDLLPLKSFTLAAAPVFALLVAADQGEAWRKWLLGLAVGVPLVTLLFVSSGPWGSYWGAILQPMALSVAPAVALAAVPGAPLAVSLSAPHERPFGRRAR